MVKRSIGRSTDLWIRSALVGLAVASGAGASAGERAAPAAAAHDSSQPIGSRTAAAPRAGEAKRIALDFREVEIGSVLKFFSIVTGMTIVPDPGLSGPVTILAPRPVSVEEGLKVLEAVLSTKGYAVQREPLMLRIVSRQRSPGGPTAAGVRR